MRIIRFRVWDIQNERMVYDPDRFEPAYPDENKVSDWVFYETWQDRDDGIGRNCEVMQFTGLKDKSGNLSSVYEGDIVSLDGKIIGTIYENSDLLKDKTNLIIEGLGTSKWRDTEQKAMERGCKYAE